MRSGDGSEVTITASCKATCAAPRATQLPCIHVYASVRTIFPKSENVLADGNTGRPNGVFRNRAINPNLLKVERGDAERYDLNA